MARMNIAVMRKLSLFVVLFLMTTGTPSRADVGGSVAVLDIMTTAVNPKFVNIMTEILATEIEALGVYENVIAGRDIATMVGFERQREMIGCDHAECLVELGGALGVDRLVSGHIAKLGETFVVQIKLINITEQKTEARVYQTVKGQEDILIQTIKDSVGKLVPPSVAKPVSGVALNPPSAPNASTKSTHSHAHSSTGPGVAPWLLMGLGAVGVGVGAVFGATAQSTLDEINDPNATGTQLLVADGKSSALMANVGFGVGAAAGITGLLWYLLGSSAEDSHAAVLSFDDGLGMAFGGQF